MKKEEKCVSSSGSTMGLGVNSCYIVRQRNGSGNYLHTNVDKSQKREKWTKMGGNELRDKRSSKTRSYSQGKSKENKRVRREIKDGRCSRPRLSYHCLARGASSTPSPQ